MSEQQTLNRRAFFRAGAAATASWYLTRPRAVAAAAPSERLTLGFIGAGGISGAHWPGLLAQTDTQIVGICDVDGQRRDRLVNTVDERYKTKGCTGYRDFRDLLARPDLDAVVICTPDNWHALQVIAAARAGKHMYSEKPLARTVVEGRAMVTAVKQHGVVFQHGTQQRSDPRMRHACELVRNGRIGKVKRVVIGVPGGKRSGWGKVADPPAWFDYDLWLGPAPYAPYSPERVNNGYGWWFMEDYSAGGFISGWGVHHVDIAQWALGTELTGPVEIEGTGDIPTDGLCDTPVTWNVRYHFGNDTEIVFQSGNDIVFEGELGRVVTNRGKCVSTPSEIANEEIPVGETKLYRSDNHHRNWLDCIKTGRETVAPIEIGQRSQTICCLADIAIRLGRRLRWDAATETVVGDAEANRMLGRALRAPWTL